MDIPPDLTFQNSTFYPQYIYMFCMYLGKTANCALYSIQWLVFKTKMPSVYCVVQTWPLNKMNYMSLKDSFGYIFILSVSLKMIPHVCVPSTSMVPSLHVTKSQHKGAAFCSFDVKNVICMYINMHPTDISWPWPAGTRVHSRAYPDWVNNN